MKRRDVLKRSAALATIGAVAGCTGGSGDEGDGGSGGGSTDTDTPEPTETATPTPQPQVASSQVLSSDGSCGSGNDASVTVEDGVVEVDGKITAPNPCHRAELQESAYDAASDEMSVSVEVVEDGGMCTQCVATVEYEAEVRYEGSQPGTVSVAHATEDQTTQVASTSN
jgi:hypothetical protein